MIAAEIALDNGDSCYDLLLGWQLVCISDPHPTVLAKLVCVSCGDARYEDLGPRPDAVAPKRSWRRQREFLYCRSCERPDVSVLGWASDLEADCHCLIAIARDPHNPERLGRRFAVAEGGLCHLCDTDPCQKPASTDGPNGQN